MLLNCKKTEKPRVLLLGPTSISAVNVVETTIHSALGIKSGAKLSGLSDKTKSSLRNKLSEVKPRMIDIISMVSSDLWIKIDARLSEIISTGTVLPFAGYSIIGNC